MNLVYVAMGGALGSSARYLLAGAINRHGSVIAPAGTFVVNVLGCFLFGILVGLADRRLPLSVPARAFLLVGVLGGFTTFSSYTFETFTLAREAQLWRAAINAAGQVVLGLAALWAGVAAVRAW